MADCELPNPRDTGHDANFLIMLETKVWGLSLTPDAVLAFIDSNSDETTQGFNKEELELLKEIKENKLILVKAAKFGKEDFVDFLIKCGVNVNDTDENGMSAADYAWRNKNYKILLSVLSADSRFPKGFNFDDLNEKNEDFEKIKKLVAARNNLHEIVKKGSVEDVADLKLGTLKFYFNVANKSLTYVAIKNKHFQVYAFLKSIGAEFAKNEEQFVQLSDTEKTLLRDAMVFHFPSVSNSHIFYLVSKSRSQRPIENLSDKLMHYFEKLDEIPEISLILKVVQYADYLDLIFDFEEEEVSKVNPQISAKDLCRGLTLNKLGRIFFAVNSQKRKEEEILSTIAHELAHMAMEILYENECNPYRKTDEDSRIFLKEFKNRIRRDFKNSVSGPSEELMGAFQNYKPSDYDSELIVRIPQILIQFKEGRDWLKKNIPELYDFYTKSVKRKCEEFITQSVILKPKNMIKSMNESIGEIVGLKKHKIFFKDLHNIIENEEKSVLLCGAKSTLLGILYTLQGIYGKSYADSYNNFLVVKFKNFLAHEEEIRQAFFMDGINLLIIDVPEKPSNDKFYDVCRSMSFVLDAKPKKKIIFVTNKSGFEFLRNNLDDGNNFLNAGFKPIFLSELNLNYLSDKSQTGILRKKVLFQGKPTLLENLIQNKNFYEFIGPEIIESLVNGEKVNIGTEIYGFSDLEGPYSDIVHKINFDSLLGEIENSNNFFIISSDLKDELISHFKAYFSENWINTEFLDKQTYSFKGKVINEKVILVNEYFGNRDFKDFCKNNRSKKCYLIKLKNLLLNSFTLQRMYVPDYYVKRKFKKIILKLNDLKTAIVENKSEMFIVTSKEDALMKLILKYQQNVAWLGGQEAENEFEVRSKLGETVHWFQKEDGVYSWKNSHGSIKNLRSAIVKHLIDKENGENNLSFLTPEKNVFEEEELVSQIMSKKVVMIVDNPGMGKSTTLTALCEAKPIADKHWIFRINLKNHLQAIREWINYKELSIGRIILFLQEVDPNLKKESEEILLKLALTDGNKFARNVLIAFDGFDEILDREDRQNVIDLFVFLKNNTTCKILITSRWPYKQDLEDALETLAFEFDPFDDETKKIFVGKYLKDRLDLILNKESFSNIFGAEKNSLIEIFKEGLLLKMREIFRRNAARFAGTPLQLNLVLMGSVKYFISWVENKNRPSLDFDYLGNNELEVYENFIERKYQVYFDKCYIIEKKRQIREKKNSEKYNRELAESLVSNRKILKPDEDDKKIYLLIGLIQSKNDENFEFIHFTFREFYSALIFSEYLLKDVIDPAKIKFAFKEIFSRSEFYVIRFFLNFLLSNKISEKNLEQFKKVITSNVDIVPTYTSFDSFLYIAAEEGNEALFKFFNSIYISMSDLYKITNIVNCNFFSTAFKTFENPHIVSELLKIIDVGKMNNSWEAWYYKCLIFHSALLLVSRPKSFGPKYNAGLILLLKEIEKIFTKKEARLFFNVNHKDRIFQKIIETSDSRDSLKSVMKIIKNAFSDEEKAEFLKMVNPKGPNLFFLAAENLQFLEIFFKQSEKILNVEDQRQLLMMKDNFGRTILHVVAGNEQVKIVELILEKIGNLDQKNRDEIFLATDKSNKTALHYAADQNRMTSTKHLMEKAGEMLSIEKIKEFFFSIFDAAAKRTCLEFVFGEMEKILTKNDLDQFLMNGSILESACESDYLENLKFVLAKIELLSHHQIRKLLTVTDKDGRSFFLGLALKGKLDAMDLITQMFDKYLALEEQQMVIMDEKFGFSDELVNKVLSQNKTELNIFFLDRILKVFGAGVKTVDVQKIYCFIIQYCPAGFLADETVLNTIIALLLEDDSNAVTFLKLAILNKDSKVFKFVLDKIELTEKLMFIATEGKYFLLTLLEDSSSFENLNLLFSKISELLSPDKLFALLSPQRNQTKLDFHAVADVLVNQTPNKMFPILTAPKHRDFDREAILYVAAENPKSLKLLFAKMEKHFSVEKQRELLMMTKHLDQNLLHIAFRLTSSESAKLILEKAEKIFTREELNQLLTSKPSKLGFNELMLILQNQPFNVDRSPVIHLAVQNQNADTLKLLFKVMEKNLSFKQQREFFEMTNSDNKNVFRVVFELASLEKIISVLEKAKKLFMPDELFQLILRNESVWLIRPSAWTEHRRFVLAQAETFLTPDRWRAIKDKPPSNSKVILNIPAKNMDLHQFELLFENLENVLSGEQLRELLMMNDDYNRNIFSASFTPISAENSKLILEKAKQILTKEERRLLLIPKPLTKTIFHWAAEYRNLQLLILLLNESEEVMSERDKIELMMTKVLNDSDFYSEKKPELPVNSLLHIAAYERNFGVLKILIEFIEKHFRIEDQSEFFVMKNSENQIPFQTLICSKNVLRSEKCEMLLFEKMGEILTEHDWMQLMTNDNGFLKSVLQAAKSELLKLVLDKCDKVLLDEKFLQLLLTNYEENGTILHMAVLNQDLKKVKIILGKAKERLATHEWSEFIMMRDKMNRSVLHVAVTSELIHLLLKEAEMLLAFVQRRQLLTMKDVNGWTVLHIAAGRHDVEALEVTKLLLQEGEKIFAGQDLECFIVDTDVKNRTAIEISYDLDNYVIGNFLSAVMGERVDSVPSN